MISDPYERLLRVLEDDSLEERIDKPIKDAAQDGWVRTLEARQRKGNENPNAQTVDELKDAYQDDAGLLVQAYRHAYEDAQRKLRGHGALTPYKTQALKNMYSLDEQAGDNEEDLTNHDWIEDVSAAIAFETVELSDILTNDPRYTALDDEKREIVQRFSLAWAIQEAGLPVPNKVRKQIGRDRKKSGLPLELKLGRR